MLCFEDIITVKPRADGNILQTFLPMIGILLDDRTFGTLSRGDEGRHRFAAKGIDRQLIQLLNSMQQSPSQVHSFNETGRSDYFRQYKQHSRCYHSLMLHLQRDTNRFGNQNSCQ